MSRNELRRARPAARTACGPWPSPATPPPPPSRRRPFPSSSPATTSWAAPRPAPARPPASRLPILHKLLPQAEHQPVAGASSRARADPRAHARARDPGRGSDQGIRQVHRPALHLRVRRRRHQGSSSPIVRAGVEILVATPGRLLDHIEQQEREPRRRSRSSCSTKPIACSTWASSRTSSGSWRCCRRGQAAEPALLGHVQQRDQEARRPAAERSRS